MVLLWQLYKVPIMLPWQPPKNPNWSMAGPQTNFVGTEQNWYTRNGDEQETYQLPVKLYIR